MIFSFSVVCLQSRTRNRKQWSLVLVLLCAVFSELSTVVKYRLLLPTGTPWVVHNSDSYFILTQTYFTLWKYLQNYSHIQLPLVLYGIINPLNTVRWKFWWSKNIWRQSSPITMWVILWMGDMQKASCHLLPLSTCVLPSQIQNRAPWWKTNSSHRIMKWWRVEISPRDY